MQCNALRGKGRAIARNAGWRKEACLIRPREVGSQIGIAFRLQYSVKNAKTCAEDGVTSQRVSKADTRREICFLRGHEAVVIDELYRHVVFRQRIEEGRPEDNIPLALGELKNTRPRA